MIPDGRKVRIVIKVYGPDRRLLTEADKTMPLELSDQPLVNIWDAWDETYGVDDD